MPHDHPLMRLLEYLRTGELAGDGASALVWDVVYTIVNKPVRVARVHGVMPPLGRRSAA